MNDEESRASRTLVTEYYLSLNERQNVKRYRRCFLLLYFSSLWLVSIKPILMVMQLIFPTVSPSTLLFGPTSSYVLHHQLLSNVTSDMQARANVCLTLEYENNMHALHTKVADLSLENSLDYQRQFQSLQQDFEHARMRLANQINESSSAWQDASCLDRVLAFPTPTLVSKPEVLARGELRLSPHMILPHKSMQAVFQTLKTKLECDDCAFSPPLAQVKRVSDQVQLAELEWAQMQSKLKDQHSKLRDFSLEFQTLVSWIQALGPALVPLGISIPTLKPPEIIEEELLGEWEVPKVVQLVDDVETWVSRVGQEFQLELAEAEASVLEIQHQLDRSKINEEIAVLKLEDKMFVEEWVHQVNALREDESVDLLEAGVTRGDVWLTQWMDSLSHHSDRMMNWTSILSDHEIISSRREWWNEFLVLDFLTSFSFEELVYLLDTSLRIYVLGGFVLYFWMGQYTMLPVVDISYLRIFRFMSPKARLRFQLIRLYWHFWKIIRSLALVSLLCWISVDIFPRAVTSSSFMPSEAHMDEMLQSIMAIREPANELDYFNSALSSCVQLRDWDGQNQRLVLDEVKSLSRQYQRLFQWAQLVGHCQDNPELEVMFEPLKHRLERIQENTLSCLELPRATRGCATTLAVELDGALGDVVEISSSHARASIYFWLTFICWNCTQWFFIHMMGLKWWRVMNDGMVTFVGSCSMTGRVVEREMLDRAMQILLGLSIPFHVVVYALCTIVTFGTWVYGTWVLFH